MNAESKDTGFVTAHALLGVKSGVDLEKNAVERRPEIGTVDGSMARRLGVVDILTFCAEEFNGAHIRDVVLAHREQRMAITHNTGTFAKIAPFVFVKLDSSIDSLVPVLDTEVLWAYHFRETPGSNNVTSMNQAIQVTR